LTHRTYEYWQVLHNIRSSDECMEKDSVEECDEFDVTAQTLFLKSMEQNYRCSGFCYKPEVPANTPTSVATTDDAAITDDADTTTMPASADAAAAATTVAASTAAAASTDGDSAAAGAAGAVLAVARKHKTNKVVNAHHKKATGRHHRMLSLLEEPAATSPFPPSLFSHNVAQASCEGMSARDVRNFAGDIGFQTFYQGLYLVVIAIATGFLKLIGACLANDKDMIPK